MSILAGASVALILCILGMSQVATVWMVIRILKDPYSKDKTFETQFYQAREGILRNGTE